MRVLEKHLRDEVTNRCVEFLDVAINFILYIEQIYSQDIFDKRLKYNQITYECQDVDVQTYIADFLNQIKPLLRKQCLDQIALVITSTDDKDVLRRYVIELHSIIEHSSNTVHPDDSHLLAELDSIFSTCLIELLRQIPISSPETNAEVRWKLQTRLCHRGNQKIEVDETFCEQLKLAENSQIPLRQLKSAHSQRLRVQLMCQDKRDKVSH